MYNVINSKNACNGCGGLGGWHDTFQLEFTGQTARVWHVCPVCGGTGELTVNTELPFDKSIEDMIIEAIEEKYGSGKAMQVSDILTDE